MKIARKINKEINRGSYVYDKNIKALSINDEITRIIHMRTSKGILQGLSLSSGKWIIINEIEIVHD